MSNFRFDVDKGQPVKVCKRCGNSVSLGESALIQSDFVLYHSITCKIEHGEGTAITNIPPGKVYIGGSNIPPCPKCRKPAKYYDEALGYEAIHCYACKLEFDLNSDAVCEIEWLK